MPRSLARLVSLGLLLAACSDSGKPADTGEQVIDLDGDGYPAGEDCDDTRVTVHPGAEEVPFNGLDDDCDPSTLDDDGDQDGFAEADDCDDTDPAVNPDAVEVCDGIDNNCDDHVDEGVTTTWFADVDGDGYGDPENSGTDCTPPDGAVLNAGDCDDLDENVHPGATDPCNGVDDDCDGEVDEDGGTDWYADADGDGFGDAAAVATACEAPEGYVADDRDCDDTDAFVNPDGLERCNGVDDDCDGVVDPDDSQGASTWYADADGDGFGDADAPTVACEAPEGYIEDASDCDDSDGAIFPGATELCNGLDDDCDGVTDPDSAVGASTFYADTDGDGFGDAASTRAACVQPAGFVTDSTDCDDSSSTVNPDATELCNDIDDDCDGVVDPDWSADAATWYDDADGDGYGDPSTGTLACDPPKGTVADASDCDDGDPDVSPAGIESCNGVDDDCDGTVDPADSVDARDWYADTDADGYGDPHTAVTACDQPVGYVADDSDCDDTTLLVNPSVPETCNGVDDDCDGLVDPPSSTDAATWYADADGDGYGFSASTVVACSQPSGYAAVGGDCNDLLPGINPGATESCNLVDDDCDGTIDESDASDATTWYADADGDGYGDPDTTVNACFSAPSGYVANSGDCYDGSASAYPGSHATETPNDGIDTDCDGYDGCTDANCDGYPDLILAAHYDNDYTTDSYLYTQAVGSYSTSYRTTLQSYGAYESVVADIDEDGYLDILLVNYYNGSTRKINSYIYWGSASGYSSSDRASLPTQGALSAVVADFDNDGYNDIAFANHHDDSSYSTSSYVYWGSAAGYSSSDRTSLATLGARRVFTLDFDDDGYGDLLFCNWYSGSAYSTSSYLYWGSSAGFSSSDRTDLATIGCQDAGFGDVNGDGWTDIAFANYYDGSSYSVNSYVYYGSASGYSSAYRVPLPTVGTLGVEVADVDLDGYDDVVYGGFYQGSWSGTADSYIYYGSSLGMSSSVVDTISTSKGVRDPMVRDLDSDGWPDLVMPRQYSGSSYSTDSYIYWGSASGYSSSDRTSLATVGVTGLSIGDLDDDGWPELLFTSYYTGSTYSTSSYLYWGSSSGYSSSDRASLAGYGVLGPISLAGDTDW